MRPLKVGLVLALIEDVETGVAPSWAELRRRALWAEAIGFDAVWIPDELLWEAGSWPGPRGWWEGVTIAAAVAEATSTITVGTWVLSALHRNPALTAKVVSTLDEISDGRLVFGFGAGHAGKQAKAFGFPEDRTVGRYEDALEIIVPLLRGEAVEFDGAYHRASLINRPSGPRPTGIPLMLGGHGPRTIGLAARYADIWSAFATKGSQPDSFAPLLETLDAALAQAGRGPETIGRSIGVDVVPEGFAAPALLGVADPLTGSPDEIAARVREFADLGVTNLELMVWPPTAEAIEAAGAVLQVLDA